MNDPRVLNMFRVLSLRNDYFTAEELSEEIGVKPRTVREFIRLNRDEVESRTDARLEYKNNFGYRLVIENRASFDAYLKEQASIIVEEEYESPVTCEARVDWMIRHFLLDRSAVKMDDICEVLFVSRSTLTQDLKAVRRKLKEYHLDLQSKVGEGLRISGNEKDIRSCVSDYFFYDEYHGSTNFESNPLGRFDAKYKDVVIKTVHDVLQEGNYQITDVGFHNLCVHIIISLFRIENGFAGNEKANIDVSKYPQEFMLSQKIQERLSVSTGYRLSDDDLGYLIMHMIGTRVFSSADENLITVETLNTVREVLRAVLNEYGIDLFDDIDLFTMLCTHIQPMSERIKNRVKMRNPLLNEIHQDSPLAYDMAALVASVLSERYQAEVDENEIGYLALHFSLALQRRSESISRKVLIVCASGRGMSQMLLYRIQKQFGSMLSEIHTASISQLKEMDTDAFDIILTTVPLTLETTARIVYVEYRITEENQKDIYLALNQEDSALQKITDAFEEELFLSDLDVSTREIAIHRVVQALEKRIPVPEEFESMVIRRELLSSTAMGRGIAMPHPETLILDQTKIVIAHLKHPIDWGREKVEWVFLLGIENKQSRIADDLIRILYEITSNTELLERLNAEPTYTCFCTILQEAIRLKDQQPHGSIFL